MFIGMTIKVLGIFLALIGIIIFILMTHSSVIKKDKDKEKMEPTDENQPQSFEGTKESITKVKTTGKHLNDLYLYIVYIISFNVCVIFIMVSFIGYRNNLSLRDIWPFIFMVVILIFFSLMLIDRAKVRSKRTIQRDLREI